MTQLFCLSALLFSILGKMVAEIPGQTERQEPVPTEFARQPLVARTRWDTTKLHLFQINAEKCDVGGGYPTDPASLTECAGSNITELLPLFGSETEDIRIVYRRRNCLRFPPR